MESEAVGYEVVRGGGREPGVAVVTLNRPERLNAWTSGMAREYREALVEADAAADVRVVVVTGAGRGFCAGADTSALTGIAGAGRYVERPGNPGAQASVAGAGGDFEHAFSFALGLSKPVIAAVNGPAAGVGFVLACFTDIRFAAAGAKLTTSFGRLGLPAEHGISWLLPRIVGVARAADLLFSSRVVLAEEALDMGLVNRVLPPEQLLDFTLDYAARIASEISPASLRAMKRQLYADLLRPLDEAATDAEQGMLEAFTSPDFAEGVAALTEKRPARFGPAGP
ncbi:MAG: enoyl-CoA hydratase/isomerase family protein [Actinobacteria bacterium]|nr:enoyl-CoA hydratase/isomerase family protein [Actinomycetota bacterium]